MIRILGVEDKQNALSLTSDDEYTSPVMGSALVMVPGSGCFTVIWPERDCDDVCIYT